MKRLFTMTCLAATFAVGLAAQSTSTATTTQDPQAGGQRGGPRTVTGCLRAGDTAGSYMLTDVMMPAGGGRRGGDTTSTGSTATGTTSGTTTATTATGAGATTGQARGGAPTSLLLTADSSVDLKAHVGHKIEVTGTMAGGRGGAGGTTTGSTTGSTATGSTTSATGTSTGASGTTGQAGGRGARSMAVTSVKMVSESCS